MKLSNVSLDLKNLVLGAVVGAVVMLLVGAGTTTEVPAKWEYKVAAVQNLPRVGGNEQREADQAFLNDLGKDGWANPIVLKADGVTIKDGKHRFRAAEYMRKKEVEVLVATDI